MNLRKFITESVKIRLNEVEANYHFVERYEDRILKPNIVNVGYEVSVGQYKVVGTYQIPDEVKLRAKEALQKLLQTRFGRNKSVAVRMFDVFVNPKNVNFNVNPSEAQGEVLVIVDQKTNSNGNKVYAIVRGDVAETLFFAKSYVTITKEKLKVDFIVNNLNNVR